MRQLLIAFACAAILFAAGCKPDAGPVLPDNLLVLPAGRPVIAPGQQLLFTANMRVQWLAGDPNGGNIDAAGVYTAPLTPGTYRVGAVSLDDPSRSAGLDVYVTPYAESFKSLYQGDLVVFFRHTEANFGSDQFSYPLNWWRSCNPDTARQLSALGEEQARRIGAVIRRMGLPVSSLYASEFCRSRRTISLMNIGLPLSTSDMLTFWVYGENERHDKTLAFINQLRPTAKSNVLIAAHSFGPGSTLPQLDQGDAAIFRVKPGEAAPEWVINIPRDAWLALFRAN